MVLQISAGDGHSAALTEDGQVWLWGTFRDSSGPIGLVEWGKMEVEAVFVKVGVDVVKIISGGDHLVMLTRDGDIFTMGNSEQGQLGRVPEMFAHREGRRAGSSRMFGLGVTTLGSDSNLVSKIYVAD